MLLFTIVIINLLPSPHKTVDGLHRSLVYSQQYDNLICDHLKSVGFPLTVSCFLVKGPLYDNSDNWPLDEFIR